MREQAHRLWDKVVILRLFDSVPDLTPVNGNTKAQKLMFLTELKAQQLGIALAHFRFFRYQLGPFSKDLACDIENLEDAGLLYKSSRRLTKRGRFLHDYVLGALEDDGLDHKVMEALELVEEIGATYGKKHGTALMNLVYGLTVPVSDWGRDEKVVNIPAFIDILDPLQTPGLVDIQPLTDDLIQDIKNELSISAAELEPDHPTFRQSVRRGLSNIRPGRRQPDRLTATSNAPPWCDRKW